ncbi:PhoX family protein [Herbiconiux sp. SYSU D00978]|uniref:PhoX family protein n=1 Tax=Herbiconiux sp. SYSU D00978 TaxID=2812562 RepID=UPI001A964750|nr:PhoX family phosphatase [Herbiconiux sp. SYSU D00978]
MAAHVRGKRSAVTCQLKCGNACAGAECNTSGNPHFRDIASAAISRRAILGFGAAGAVVLATDAFGLTAPAAEAAPKGGASAGLPFSPIAPVANTVDDFTVPVGYRWDPIIRWGDPILPGAPEFDVNAQTVESQAGQFGYNNDFLAILEDPKSKGTRGVLVANHEYVNPAIMFPPTTDAAELRRRSEIYKMAHGLSVVELERSGRGARWEYVREGEVNRRITAETPFELTGPAAGSDLLKTKGDPTGRRVLGTLNNCAGGVTPWGTILSGEENFNQYFHAPTTPERSRYGLASAPNGTNTGWEKWDPRFDASTPDYANEPNRFGWIVEIDPDDPTSTPRKHTALGRFKHEGANVIVGEDGRVVAYMGDDERGDYLYKFVSKNRFKNGNGHGVRRQNMQLLTEGDLFVARFRGDSPAAEITGSGALPSDGAFDGTGEWIPLTQNGESAVTGMTIDQVLVYTRLAADKVGATRMDRPEDVEPSLASGKIYVACTNNSNRGRNSAQPVDEANPRTGNRDGHVIEITETAGQSGRTFGWSILLLCGVPTDANTYFAGFPKDKVSPISCPDNLAFDSQGNLWISTDGAPSTIGLNDALFKVPLTGSERGRVQQFLAVPTEAETCGPVIHDTDGSVFVSVQHPGEDGSWGAQHSFFPDYAPANAPGVFRGPRPSVVQVIRG